MYGPPLLPIVIVPVEQLLTGEVVYVSLQLGSSISLTVISYVVAPSATNGGLVAVPTVTAVP